MDTRALVDDLLAGKERAWRHFLDDYGRMVYAASARLGLTPAEQDDHFQRVCIAVHRALPSLRDPRHLSTWLYNIAYRAGVDTLRQRRPNLPVSELPEDALRIDPTVLDDLERLQALSRVRDGIEGLDERCRSLLQALFLEEPPLSYVDVGRRVGIPVGSIGPTRARCLERLKNVLEDLSGGDPAPSTGQTTHEGGTRDPDSLERRE